MASLTGEHKIGKHRTRKFRGCDGCFPVDGALAQPPVAEVPARGSGEKAPRKTTAGAKPTTPGRKAGDGTTPPKGRARRQKASAPAAPAVVETRAQMRARKQRERVVYTSREVWLQTATELLRPRFAEAGFPVPEKVRVSVGWPGGRGKKKNVIGQCWPQELASDKVHAIFISPSLTDATKVLGVLVHELVHASVPKGTQHRGAFVKVAAGLGLTPPWTATGEGPLLVEHLLGLQTKLGAYDHGGLTTTGRLIVQGTRMLKVVCPEDGYTVRTTRKWLEVGNPSCPDGHEMEETK